MATNRQPKPVKPRLKDAKAYERAIRREFYDPIFARLRGRLANVSAIDQVWQAMDANVEAQAVRGVPVALIREELLKIEAYHRRRLISSFSAALGLDITPLLTNPIIRDFMTEAISANVDLIKTIPKRMHDGLKKRLIKEFETAPFDQAKLTEILRDRYKSDGYVLRRICRDQTSKTIGRLTEIRQKQLGVTGYQWESSRDERVRPTHVANDGRYFLWAIPPPETGHPGSGDIMCRCVARAAITQADRDRLKAATGG